MLRSLTTPGLATQTGCHDGFDQDNPSRDANLGSTAQEREFEFACDRYS